MTCAIVTVGDELLIGQIINTNQAYIAEQLNLIGIEISWMITVGDDIQQILAAFQRSWSTHDVVVVTGGLGPTRDDITKKAVCRFFDSELESNEVVRAHIASLLRRRAIPWNVAAEEQTMFPEKAQLIPNPVGTAPGMLFENGPKIFMVLPGVPYEMKEMIDRSVVPMLSRRVHDYAIRHLTLRTTGITESMLSDELGDLDPILGGATLAFLPAITGVRLRISVRDTNAARAQERLTAVETRIREKIERYVYATGTEELEETLGKLLKARGLTIAVAESCTGGLVAHRLTNVSGSSGYFERGIVAYSNATKIDVLRVPREILDAHGAVSREVAEAMATGVRQLAGTSIGLSTTGVAGPTGGTAEKPVGLVWVGYADPDTTLAVKFNFGEGRLRIKERAAQAAMELVRKKILAIPLP
jgi:nicotinamide-nucleotide amidase